MWLVYWNKEDEDYSFDRKTFCEWVSNTKKHADVCKVVNELANMNLPLPDALSHSGGEPTFETREKVSLVYSEMALLQGAAQNSRVARPYSTSLAV